MTKRKIESVRKDFMYLHNKYLVDVDVIDAGNDLLFKDNSNQMVYRHISEWIHYFGIEGDYDFKDKKTMRILKKYEELEY